MMNAQPQATAWQLQEAYQKLVKAKPNLYEFMQNSPLRDAEADAIFDFIEKDKQFCEEKDINL
jgi:hypothetical protein